MQRPQLILASILTLTAIAVGGCGGGANDTTDASETSPPATGTTDAATPTDDPTDEPTTPPAAEVTVTVAALADGNDKTEAMFERYTQFETAFWQSLAAGAVSAELSTLATPDAMVGIETVVTGPNHPVGGSVAITPVLEDATLADIGFGQPSLTDAVITGCSDQSQLQYEGGASGGRVTIRADLTLGDDGYVVTNYALGPDAC
ncbi:MAG TPA: hypothetical protein VIP77_05240 [Jiangellaceae bacterium]